MSILNSLKNEFTEHSTKRAFKDEWILNLQDNLPLYGRLPQVLQDTLHQKIAQFVRTTSFEGCDGLELTDEIILAVSAQACLLVLNHEGEPYPELHTVVLYPTAFSSTFEVCQSRSPLLRLDLNVHFHSVHETIVDGRKFSQ
jgi:Mlc titration factor MtfA (ptsG expression regulator)